MEKRREKKIVKEDQIKLPVIVCTQVVYILKQMSRVYVYYAAAAVPCGVHACIYFYYFLDIRAAAVAAAALL